MHFYDSFTCRKFDPKKWIYLLCHVTLKPPYHNTCPQMVNACGLITSDKALKCVLWFDVISQSISVVWSIQFDITGQS